MARTAGLAQMAQSHTTELGSGSLQCIMCGLECVVCSAQCVVISVQCFFTVNLCIYHAKESSPAGFMRSRDIFRMDWLRPVGYSIQAMQRSPTLMSPPQKGFLNPWFLQNMGCQKPCWDQATVSSLVNKQGAL